MTTTGHTQSLISLYLIQTPLSPAIFCSKLSSSISAASLNFHSQKVGRLEAWTTQIKYVLFIYSNMPNLEVITDVFTIIAPDDLEGNVLLFTIKILHFI